MWEDPIVKEIHNQRKKIAEAHSYNIREIINYYREQQRTVGCAVIPYTNHQPAKTAANNRPAK